MNLINNMKALIAPLSTFLIAIFLAFLLINFLHNKKKANSYSFEYNDGSYFIKYNRNSDVLYVFEDGGLLRLTSIESYYLIKDLEDKRLVTTEDKVDYIMNDFREERERIDRNNKQLEQLNNRKHGK